MLSPAAGEKAGVKAESKVPCVGHRASQIKPEGQGLLWWCVLIYSGSEEPGRAESAL